MNHPLPFKYSLKGTPIIAGIFIVLLTVVLFCQQASSNTSNLNQKLDATIKNFMDKTRVPGVSVLVAKKDEIIFRKSFGLANIEHNIPVTNNTAFPIGSLTKQFTGLAIAQLITAGKLSLDDPLHKFFPDYPVSAKNVTVKNLLNHTSGITNYTGKKELHANAWKKHSHQDMIDWFKDEPLIFEPGTRWSYTNSGIYLLGVIIEKISGLSYADYLQKNIFTPFGMDHTYFAGSKAIIPLRASGYNIKKDGYQNARAYDSSVPFSAGSIISTTDDLWKYLNNVHRADLVSTDIRELIYKQEKLPNGETLIYTLGCLFVGKLEDHKVYSHSGEIYGFYAHEAYYPESDVTIIILTNGKGYMPGPPNLTQKIARDVLGIAHPQYTPQPIPETDTANLAGTYQFTRQSFFPYDKVIVSFEKNKLIFHIGANPDKMYPLPFFYAGKGRYIMTLDDEWALIVDNSHDKPALYFKNGSLSVKLEKNQTQ